MSDKLTPITQRDDDDNAILDQVYRQAFADVLYALGKRVLCRKCGKVLENATLERYKTLMAKRRQDVSSLQTKIQKQREVDTHRKELEKQNKRNSQPRGAVNE